MAERCDDLTHFAVEIELPGTVGCYGLIAADWDIEDTTGKPAAFLDDAALTRIRARRSELLSRWRALPAGGTLELGFTHSSPLSGASP